MDGVAEVISRLRFSSDEGAKYSGDLLAIMEILKNTTELYKGTSNQKLSNADTEVRKHKYIFKNKSALWPKIELDFVSSHTSAFI